MGELSRMTQYKEKSQKHAENINSGLFTYPILMAADILAFQAGLVPVGDDQRQHLELCRDIAIRFNNVYGDVFTVPEPHIGDVGRRVMSLQNPESKMSKSEAEAGTILLLDTPDVIRGKFKRAVTDSDNEIRSDVSKPGITNLLEIYSAVTEKSVAEAEAEFKGAGYGEFKLAVADAVIASIAPVQLRYKELMADKEYVDGIIRDSAEKARGISARTLSKVHRKVGFVNRIR
jgi:tryptophanyl-tRNA synthetase